VVHTEELHNLYSAQNVIGVIKIRMMIWGGGGQSESMPVKPARDDKCT
jgi:hypothetical protein